MERVTPGQRPRPNYGHPQAALGAESGISKSEVSRICAGLNETVEELQGRQLDHIKFLWLRDVPSPGVHDLAALLQQVGSPVGGFDGVLDDVR